MWKRWKDQQWHLLKFFPTDFFLRPWRVWILYLQIYVQKCEPASVRYSHVLTYRLLCRGKSDHLLHNLWSGNNNFIVIPAQKVFQGAQFLLFPQLLQVLLKAHSCRCWHWYFQFDIGSFCGQSFLWSTDQHKHCFLLQEDYSYEVYCKAHHTGTLWTLRFFRVIKRFLGEESFSFWSFVCLQGWVRTCSSLKKNHYIE